MLKSSGKCWRRNWASPKSSTGQLTINKIWRNQRFKNRIVGDIKHSLNSNATTLRRLGAKVYFSGPREWFDEGSLMNGTYRDLDALVTDVDVLYVA